MDKASLEQTPWAKEFREDSPVSYPQAIELALDPRLKVEIIHTCDSGFWQWAIDAGDLCPGFWMDSKPTREEAEELCHQMGWII